MHGRMHVTKALLCRYFDQPAEVKAGFPTTDWGTLDLLGYKAYRMQEGGMKTSLCFFDPPSKSL